MGFDGGKTIVKDFIQKVRPKQVVPAVLRYETKPGIQAQVDWGEVGKVEVDGKIKIALAHPAASNGVCPRQRCQLPLLLKVNYFHLLI
jgi:transposase